MKTHRFFTSLQFVFGIAVSFLAVVAILVTKASISRSADFDYSASKLYVEALEEQINRYELIVALLIIALVISILNGIYSYYRRDLCIHDLTKTLGKGGLRRLGHRRKKERKK